MAEICPYCGAANRDTARFCLQCGRALLAAGQIVSPGAGLLLPNTLLNNRYLIIQKIGQGGMGAVYKASDTRLGQKVVAVKELSASSVTDPNERQQARQAFEQEARMLAQLSHPNLPRVTDYFHEGGKQYLVMDFIDGQTLEQALAASGGPLDVEQIVGWAVQLCDVLEYLHGQQPAVIFRDLKPANIMLDRSGQIKLIDFGIARHFKPGKASDTASFGTAGYAPPEQYGKGQTDARSDIYALGATLHHLLTGRDPADKPFNFAAVRSLNPKVPTAVEQAIMKAVEQDPANRWGSAGEMKRALTAAPGAVTPSSGSSPGASSAYVASATPGPAAASSPATPKPVPAIGAHRAGFLPWLALALGMYAVYHMLGDFFFEAEDPVVRQLIRAGLAIALGPLLYVLSRRPGSALLMGLLLWAGADLPGATTPLTQFAMTTSVAALVIELMFAVAGARKFSFWITVLAAATGGAAGWIGGQVWYGMPLDFASLIAAVDEDAIRLVIGASAGGVVAFALAALLTPGWWKSAGAGRGDFNYVQVAFIALASVALSELVWAWLGPGLIRSLDPEPAMGALVFGARGVLALPLAFVMARRPGAALLAGAVAWLLRLSATGSLMAGTPSLAGALAFELVFLIGRYRSHGFWRLAVASALAEAALLVAVRAMQVRSFSLSLILGASLAGAVAYVVGRMVRR